MWPPQGFDGRAHFERRRLQLSVDDSPWRFDSTSTNENTAPRCFGGIGEYRQSVKAARKGVVISIGSCGCLRTRNLSMPPVRLTTSSITTLNCDSETTSRPLDLNWISLHTASTGLEALSSFTADSTAIGLPSRVPIRRRSQESAQLAATRQEGSGSPGP